MCKLKEKGWTCRWGPRDVAWGGCGNGATEPGHGAAIIQSIHGGEDVGAFGGHYSVHT